MKIIICLDYSPFTEKILLAARSFIAALINAEITVLHVVDERLFCLANDYKTQLNEALGSERKNLQEWCIQYLGNNFDYIEEYGLPKLKIDEALSKISHDLLITGSHSRRELNGKITGSIAEHILQTSTTPVLVIT